MNKDEWVEYIESDVIPEIQIVFPEVNIAGKMAIDYPSGFEYVLILQYVIDKDTSLIGTYNISCYDDDTAIDWEAPVLINKNIIPFGSSQIVNEDPTAEWFNNLAMRGVLGLSVLKECHKFVDEEFMEDLLESIDMVHKEMFGEE